MASASCRRYHPLAELAPRDDVSLAIAAQMAKTRHPNVYLDLSHLDRRLDPPAVSRDRSALPQLRPGHHPRPDPGLSWCPLHDRRRDGRSPRANDASRPLGGGRGHELRAARRQSAGVQQPARRTRLSDARVPTISSPNWNRPAPTRSKCLPSRAAVRRRTIPNGSTWTTCASRSAPAHVAAHGHHPRRGRVEGGRRPGRPLGPLHPCRWNSTTPSGWTMQNMLIVARLMIAAATTRGIARRPFPPRLSPGPPRDESSPERAPPCSRNWTKSEPRPPSKPRNCAKIRLVIVALAMQAS